MTVIEEQTMRSSSRRLKGRGRFAAVAVLGALALAAPISGANAAVPSFPFWGGAGGLNAFPIPLPSVPVAQQGAVGGTVIAQPFNGAIPITGCGSNRPDTVGAAGGASPTVCGNLLSFVAPGIGQVNSQVGPTIIGATILAPVTMSGGPTVNAFP
jgi:hypothetical protein